MEDTYITFAPEKCLKSICWYKLNAPFLGLVWRFATSNHIAEILFPSWFQFNRNRYSAWGLKTGGSTFHLTLSSGGNNLLHTPLFLNSKTSCSLCSGTTANRETFLKDHSQHHCQEKKFLARREPGSIWYARWWFQLQLNSCWKKVFELQMRKASMTNFQVLEASEGNGKCWYTPTPNHMHTCRAAERVPASGSWDPHKDAFAR